MGRTYLFECSKCQYRAIVAGGADRGLHCLVQTVRCSDCRALFDVPVRLRVSEHDEDQPYRLWRRNLLIEACPAVSSPRIRWQDRLAFGGSPKLRWVTVRFRCPVSAYHRVQPWQQPGKCPRCAADLERSLTPFRIWE